MRTILISLFASSYFCFGQLKEPLGMERYLTAKDSISSFHFDIYSNESVLYTYILYDSLDSKIDVYALETVWLEFNRLLNYNEVNIENFGFIMTPQDEIENMYYFSIFDLIKGFNFVQKLQLDSDDDTEAAFGFFIEQDGWTYSIYVLDEYLYTTVETTDLATIRKFEKKYPNWISSK